MSTLIPPLPTRCRQAANPTGRRAVGLEPHPDFPPPTGLPPADEASGEPVAAPQGTRRAKPPIPAKPGWLGRKLAELSIVCPSRAHYGPIGTALHSAPQMTHFAAAGGRECPGMASPRRDLLPTYSAQHLRRFLILFRRSTSHDCCFIPSVTGEANTDRDLLVLCFGDLRRDVGGRRAETRLGPAGVAAGRRRGDGGLRTRVVQGETNRGRIGVGASGNRARPGMVCRRFDHDRGCGADIAVAPAPAPGRSTFVTRPFSATHRGTPRGLMQPAVPLPSTPSLA